MIDNQSRKQKDDDGEGENDRKPKIIHYYIVQHNKRSDSIA